LQLKEDLFRILKSLFVKFMKISFKPMKWPIICPIGIIAVVQYCFFSFLAFLSFPSRFDPFNNFLSQLGNYDLNPNGAFFYFLAILFSGILTILFYWQFYVFFSTEESNFLLKLILILGILNGISILGSGIFAESVNYPFHFFFSFSIFFTLLPLLGIANIFLWTKTELHKIISLSGIIVIVIDLLFVFLVIIGGELFDNAAIMEWLSLASYFLWMFLLVLFIVKNHEG
jgi:hypothetical protein